MCPVYLLEFTNINIKIEYKKKVSLFIHPSCYFTPLTVYSVVQNKSAFLKNPAHFII